MRLITVRVNRCAGVSNGSEMVHGMVDQVLPNLLALRKTLAIFTVYLVNTTAANTIMWMVL